MGLDNGFLVKSDKRKITREDLPEGIQYPFENDYNGIPEIVYWRKNWGLRTAITRILWPEEVNKEAGETPYHYYAWTSREVIDVIGMIAIFLDKEKWEDEGRSIWTYEEARLGLIRDIINLSLMVDYMAKNPDVYLEFYDSY